MLDTCAPSLPCFAFNKLSLGLETLCFVHCSAYLARELSPQARRLAPPSIRGSKRVPLAITRLATGCVQGTNHWTTNGNASPCFGLVSDLPAQSRGRLLSGVGRTGFIDTLPTLSDPRRPCLVTRSSRLRTYTIQTATIQTKQKDQRQDKDKSQGSIIRSDPSPVQS